MAVATKAARTLIAAGTSAVPGTPQRFAIDLRTSLGGRITFRMTNGATGPTAQCVCRVMQAHTDGATPATGALGATWKDTGYNVGNGTLANTDTHLPPFDFGPGFGHLQVEFAGNTAQNVTVEAIMTEVVSFGGDAAAPVIFIDSIPALIASPTTLTYVVKGYHAAGDVDQGIYYYDAAASKTLHNSGTIIDPGRTFPSDWTNETQKTTWYTPAGSGTGVWRRVKTAVIDGRIFGVKADGLTTPVTDNTQALQKALDSEKTIYLPGGKYLTSTIQVPDKFKLLASSGRIHLVTSGMMIFRASGNQNLTDCEFHGILESTSTDTSGSTDQRGLFISYFLNGIIENLNFDGVEYICQNTNSNGINLAIGFPGAAQTWLKSASFKGSKFTCGRMGYESVNHENDLTISGVTIGAGAVFTVGSAKIRDGQTVLITGLVGSGAVTALNDKFFIATTITSTTFQLKSANGVLVDTTGGTYTSGGSVYVYRVENVDVSDSVVYECGVSGGTTYPIGISFSGPSLNCKSNYVKGYKCATTLIEWSGASKSFCIGCETYNGSGGLMLASNVRKMYGNTLSNCKTVGQQTAGRAIIIYNNYGTMISDNELSTFNGLFIDSCNDLIVSRNIIRVKNHHRAILMRSSNAVCQDNLFLDNTIDNSLSGVSEFPIEAEHPNVNYNVIDRTTVIPYNGTIPTAIFPESGGATGNKTMTYRIKGSSTGYIQAA